MARQGEGKSVGVALSQENHTSQAGAGPREPSGPLPSLSWGGSDECLDQPVSILETKWIRSGREISFEGERSFESEISFESSQDQLRVEREARVELWSSLLVGGIAASLEITRAMPGTSASPQYS